MNLDIIIISMLFVSTVPNVLTNKCLTFFNMLKSPLVFMSKSGCCFLHNIIIKRFATKLQIIRLINSSIKSKCKQIITISRIALTTAII